MLERRKVKEKSVYHTLVKWFSCIATTERAIYLTVFIKIKKKKQNQKIYCCQSYETIMFCLNILWLKFYLKWHNQFLCHTHTLLEQLNNLQLVLLQISLDI